MSLAALARDLNLSKSTVSRALNDYTDVSIETRERVRVRAAELGYVANPLAQRLKRGRADAVGVVLPPPLSNGTYIEPFYSMMLGSLVVELEKANLQLLVTTQKSTVPDNDTESYLRMMQGGNVDALLILRTRVNDPRVALAVQNNFPFVTFGRTQCEIPYSWADVDNEQAFYLAVKRQLQRGHREVAFINTATHYNYASLRLQGYKKALDEAAIPFDPQLVQVAGLTNRDGYAAARLLLQNKKVPTAMVCTTDDLAIGAMAACREAGIEPGRDIAVTGFGNHPAAAFSSPPLTTIEPDPSTIGQTIGNYLRRRLRGETTELLHYLQPVKIIERHSDPAF